MPLPLCENWNDWTAQPEVHSPFHHWHWDNDAPNGSEQRLGERLYTAACLLWTALHDRRLGLQLHSRNPNWSAVASYYSMVHALRLVWFLLYGSYPTGHKAMADVLAGERGVPADWGREVRLPRRVASITLAALQGAIREGLGSPDLANRLPQVGAIFDVAIDLRTDSNYESLILAHQYSHTSTSEDFVSVQQEFSRATEAMIAANRLVLRFSGDLLLAAFKDDAGWFCPVEVFRPAQLLQLVLGYVHDRISTCLQRAGEPLHSASTWADDLGGLQTLLDAAPFDAGEATRLMRYARFSEFEMKRGIMREFESKVRRLDAAVRASAGPARTDS